MVEKMLSCKSFVLGGMFFRKSLAPVTMVSSCELDTLPTSEAGFYQSDQISSSYSSCLKLWQLRHDWPLLDTLSDFAIARCHEFEAPDLAISAWSWAKLEAGNTCCRESKRNPHWEIVDFLQVRKQQLMGLVTQTKWWEDFFWVALTPFPADISVFSCEGAICRSIMISMDDLGPQNARALEIQFEF